MIAPVTVQNAECAPVVRALGYYKSNGSRAATQRTFARTLKVGIPPRFAEVCGWTADDHVQITVWAHEDGTKVLVLERAEGPTR